MTRVPKFIAAALVGAVLLVGCSSDSSSNGTTTTVAAKTLQVLVTNDDGFDSAGIDAVVETFRLLPNVEVTVVAPATQQSGKGSTVTGGPLTATDQTTKSGYPVKAVNGTPADAIIWALEQGGISIRPDFVVSGVNAGANMGTFINLSGTIGAARAAVQRGIPAIAVSNGAIAGPYDPVAAADLVADWFEENRAGIADGTIDRTQVFNLNPPTCATGAIRGIIDVPPASTDAEMQRYNEQPDCSSTATDPTSDIAAYLMGFAPLSLLSATPAA